MDPVADDDTLALAARAGDEVALRHLVDRHRPTIHALAATRFLPGGDRDDLVQEGMVGLWYAIRDFRPDVGRFTPFARVCIDRQMWSAVTRANRLRHQALRDTEPLQQACEVPDAAVGPEAHSLAEDAVTRLGAHLRAVLTDLEHEALARYVAGDSYEDIAAALTVHRKRIDNALQRARRKLVDYQERELVLTG